MIIPVDHVKPVKTATNQTTGNFMVEWDLSRLYEIEINGIQLEPFLDWRPDLIGI